MPIEIIKKKLDALKFLPEADKEIIRSGLRVNYETAQDFLKSLSIFCQDFTRHEYGQYKFLSYGLGAYYYSNSFNKAGIFFNKEKKLLYGCRNDLSHLNSFVEYIDHYLIVVSNTSFENVKNIGNDFVGMERWSHTYGHYHDELFTLAYISKIFPDFYKSRFLLDYPDDDLLNTDNFTYNKNYFSLDQMAFNGNSLNLYRYKEKILELNNVTFIENKFNSPTFHKFPLTISDYIASQCDKSSLDHHEKVFLTRGDSYRDVGNKDQVENFFAGCGYKIFNPEQLTIVELIALLARCSSIGLYWGSGMTNLAYAKSGSKVTVVKSNSYASESIDLWKNLMGEHKLKLSVVSPFSGNEISLADLVEC